MQVITTEVKSIKSWCLDIDEAIGAYKDINLVIQQQLDLIKVLVELKPLAVIKG